MIRSFVCYSVLILLLADYAGAEPAPGMGYYLGMLGSHRPISMVIGGEYPALGGKYRYLQFGAPIWLTNLSKTEDSLQLTESPTTGRTAAAANFHGKLDEHYNFEGTWTSADLKRSLPVHLKRVAELATYAVHEPRFSVERSIPQFKSKSPFFQAINVVLAEDAKKELALATAESREDTKEAGGGPYPYEDSVTTEVLYADESMVSLLFQSYSYTGGAHGNHGFSAVTFTCQDGKPVKRTPVELLSESANARINKLIVADLTRQKAAWVDNAKTGKLADAVINPTSSGVLFTFGPYEVDCYAAGTFSVMIPYSDLKGAIPVDSPLLPLSAGALRAK